MTNFEKIKDEIANMNEEELFRWRLYGSPWCKDIRNKNKSKCRGGCLDCAVNWMKEKYEEPIPELKTGMFVETNRMGYGVVVNDEIIYQNGTHGKIDDLKEYIITVFNATCFIDCEDDVGIIWEKR